MCRMAAVQINNAPVMIMHLAEIVRLGMRMIEIYVITQNPWLFDHMLTDRTVVDRVQNMIADGTDLHSGLLSTM